MTESLARNNGSTSLNEFNAYVSARRLWKRFSRSIGSRNVLAVHVVDSANKFGLSELAGSWKDESWGENFCDKVGDCRLGGVVGNKDLRVAKKIEAIFWSSRQRKFFTSAFCNLLCQS